VGTGDRGELAGRSGEPAREAPNRKTREAPVGETREAAPGETLDPGTEPSRRRLVVGLGNPGGRYADTRHNVGFRVVEELARRRGVPLDRNECNALVGAAEEIHLALPQTFMNRSGYALRCLVERHGFAPAEILVVLDEVALPLGRLRLRGSGSPGGHRGLESILESLQSDGVHRLRLGVREEADQVTGEGLADYVLGPFSPPARETVEAMVARGADACESWLDEGMDRAMARFNGSGGLTPPPPSVK
jgi:PTH1 family peptidyl-tRNA hydrolase